MNWNVGAARTPKALLIHAHPDDETIFAGGLLLACPHWRWEIVCITMQLRMGRRRDRALGRNRRREYDRALTAFKRNGVNITNYYTLLKHDAMQVSEDDCDDWLRSLVSLNLRPDVVITHNPTGEYGHQQHVVASKVARAAYANVWGFVYPTGDVEPYHGEQENAVELSPSILKTKQQIFNRSYRSQKRILWRYLPDLMAYEFRQGPEIFTSLS